MMTLANYGIGSGKHKERNSEKLLSKSLQIRNRAELLLKQHLKTHHRLNDAKANEILTILRDYYSRIPLESVIWNKYQAKQCIFDSILLLDTKFNPYKAQQAFKMVEKMLLNLIYLPWHSEFRKIHLYSGLFRSISDTLIGIEELFKAGGFEFVSNNLMVMILPEEKMPQVDDGECVYSVIFDCMMAQVVCSDIISVFESCCKAAKVTVDGSQVVTNTELSWLQAYLTERSLEVTEQACLNVHETLRELTSSLCKSGTGRLDEPEDKFQNDDHLKSMVNRPFKNNSLDRQHTVSQDLEAINTSTISDDLLRIPISNSDRNKRTLSGNYSQDNNVDLNQSHSNKSKVVQPRTSYRGSAQDQNSNCASSTQQYYKRSVFDCASSKHKDTLESSSSYSSHNNGRISAQGTDADLLQSDPVECPHNDREPLLPKQDRRYVTHYNQNQFRKPQLYDEYDNVRVMASSDSNHQTKTNRYHSPSPSYFKENSSQVQSAPCNQTRGLAMKYSNSPYRKYIDLREQDKLTSGRLHWSCGSCTYNNQIGNEICEMCRNRR